MRMAGRRFDKKGCIPIILHPDRLEKPLHWREPRMIFVNSMSDLFHEDVPHNFIGRICGVMAEAHWHTFQILTKRAKEMAEFSRALAHYPKGDRAQRPVHGWPPNVWLGVSAEDQRRADERIPLLLQTPAAVRFVSLEPLLGPVDILAVSSAPRCSQPIKGLYGVDTMCALRKGHTGDHSPIWRGDRTILDWVIVGGESGPGARPMHPDWARGVRDQCAAAGVPFFFKQIMVDKKMVHLPYLDGRQWKEFPHANEEAKGAPSRHPHQ